MEQRLSRQIGVAFALCAFAVSIASGLISSAPASSILLRSVVVLLVGSAIGRVLGAMASVAVNEHLAATTVNNPIPKAVEVPEPSGGTDEVEVLED